jgi:poly(A) polymerase
LAITRRSAEGMRRIVAALPRVLGGRPGRLAHTETFQLALDVAEADLRSEGRSTAAIVRLRQSSRQ